MSLVSECINSINYSTSQMREKEYTLQSIIEAKKAAEVYVRHLEVLIEEHSDND